MSEKVRLSAAACHRQIFEFPWHRKPAQCQTYSFAEHLRSKGGTLQRDSAMPTLRPAFWRVPDRSAGRLPLCTDSRSHRQDRPIYPAWHSRHRTRCCPCNLFQAHHQRHRLFLLRTIQRHIFL